jgi:multidrug efflux pump
LLSALVGTALRGLDVNIFVQIGFVVLVGLACKNAILVVEFAKQQRDLGKSRLEAIVNAAVTRPWPIVMTSACFVHMVPPCFATGAGAELRRSLGTAVLWGAFGVTLFGIFLTPLLFYVVDWLTNRNRRPAATPAAALREAPAWATPVVNHWVVHSSFHRSRAAGRRERQPAART